MKNGIYPATNMALVQHIYALAYKSEFNLGAEKVPDNVSLMENFPEFLDFQEFTDILTPKIDDTDKKNIQNLPNILKYSAQLNGYILTPEEHNLIGSSGHGDNKPLTPGLLNNPTPIKQSFYGDRSDLVPDDVFLSDLTKAVDYIRQQPVRYQMGASDNLRLAMKFHKGLIIADTDATEQDLELRLGRVDIYSGTIQSAPNFISAKVRFDSQLLREKYGFNPAPSNHTPQ
jgi:hypothetical protein